MWYIAGTAVQGLRHIRENIPCQDKIYSLQKNNITAIALADGAGSAKYSHYGAEVIVKSICETLCESFSDIVNNENSFTVKQTLLESLLPKIAIASENLRCGIDDLASTLLAAAADDKKIFLLHIGDGIAACFRSNSIFPASYPDNGEFKNETFFITSPYALQRMRIYRGNAEEISGLALMSDGTDYSFFNVKEGRFAVLLDEIKRRCIMYSQADVNAALEELFNDVVRKQTHDDCSMILMCRTDKYFRGYRDLDEYEQNIFLGSRTHKGKVNREKIFSILLNKECASRYQIIKAARKFGLKQRQTIGLLRDLHKNGFIQTVHFNPPR